MSTKMLRLLALVTIAVTIAPVYFYEVVNVNVSSLDQDQQRFRLSGPPVKVPQPDTPPPRLVLHVGLPKTATSAIQCRLNDMERRDILSEKLSAKIVEIESCRVDTFMHKARIAKYLDEFPSVNPNDVNNQSVTETSCKYSTYASVIKGSSVLQHCLDIWIKHYDRVSVPDCWGYGYQKYIRNYHKYGTSVFVISNENLALPTLGNVPNKEVCGTIFDNMLDSLGNNSQIDIVLSVRLHFDRLLSMFGQEYDGDKMYSRPKLKKWPEDGGGAVPSLEKYINDFPLNKLLKVIECFRYASKNPRIDFKVIDFHTKQPGIVTSFMQIVTRNATLTQELADGNHMLGTENLAMERDNKIQFDRIAIAAKKAGFVPDSKERYEVRNDVSKYLEEKGLNVNDLKLKCPSEQFFDDLINNTIMIHQSVFPDAPVQAVRNRLRMFDFQPFRDIFCEVDGDATIRDEVMQSFFEQ